jgi:hypothetical protein
MVTKGRLNEAAAPELAHELVVCILTSQEYFAQFVDPKPKRIRYPVDLADMMTALRRQFLTEHFRDEAVYAKRQRGEIKEQWHSTIVSYSATLRPDEWQDVLRRVETALSSGDELSEVDQNPASSAAAALEHVRSAMVSVPAFESSWRRSRAIVRMSRDSHPRSG